MFAVFARGCSLSLEAANVMSLMLTMLYTDGLQEIMMILQTILCPNPHNLSHLHQTQIHH